MSLIYKGFGCTDAHCGCSSPCGACTGAQNSASIVVSGACSALCAMSGTYPSHLVANDLGSICAWTWEIGVIGLSIYLCKADGTWGAVLVDNNTGVAFGDAASAFCGGSNVTVVAGVACTGGLIVAGFTLAGTGACVGCTATITI